MYNTSNVIFKLDAEPFIPKKQTDFEVEQKNAIEKMYRYYNYLIMDQNRDKLKQRFLN